MRLSLPLRTRPGFASLNPGYEEKKEAERRQTLSATACLAASAHPAGRARLSAFHGGSRPRDLRIPRTSFGPGFAERSACRWRGYPAGVRPGCSEHLACRSLCRQVDVRNRPSAKATKPCPRAPQLAPASRSHRLTSLHEEREDGACTRRARRVKPNHLHVLLFDFTAVFALRLSGGTTRARCDVRIKKILIGRRKRPARLHCAKSRRRRDACRLAVAKSRVILCR